MPFRPHFLASDLRSGSSVARKTEDTCFGSPNDDITNEHYCLYGDILCEMHREMYRIFFISQENLLNILLPENSKNTEESTAGRIQELITFW